MSTTRLPPHSIEAEEHCLACCLLDGAATLADLLNGQLSPQMFYVPANVVIFEFLATMLAEGKSIDLSVLAQELGTAKRLDEIGGYAYLMQISSAAPTTAKVSYFARKVRECFFLREAIKEANGLVEMCHRYAGDGLAETLSKPVSRLLMLAAGSQADPEPEWEQVVDDAGEVLEQIIEHKGLPAHMVIEFPWACMNERFTPMQRGQLVEIAARPSIGKSSLARPIAAHAALNGHKVYFITLEVNPVQIALQIAASVSGVGIRSVVKAHVKDQADLKAALRNLRSYGMTVSRRDRTIARIIARARALHTKGALDLLVLDHGLLVDEVASASKEERATVIGSLTKALKKLATELNIVCLLLWQLNRASVKDGNREPNLTDLKDSGSLEEDADKVLFIHRPTEDYYTGQPQHEHASKEDCPNYFQNIIQAKGRDDGTSILSFYFNRATATFRPASP